MEVSETNELVGEIPSDEDLSTIVLVVEGKRIIVDRDSIALISRFFRALFTHQFEDSRAPVLHLDNWGKMGLTVTAVEILAEFARTRQLSIDHITAVQIFIAADALDVKDVRESAETFLGTKMLKPRKEVFINFWKMSRFFHMKILESFLDSLCLDNFGWFCCSFPLFSSQYIAAWDLPKLSRFLSTEKFSNCSEEQIFRAVVSYCRSSGSKENSRQAELWEELAPGLFKSCGSYLRYIQSVPRTLPVKVSRRSK